MITLLRSIIVLLLLGALGISNKSYGQIYYMLNDGAAASNDKVMVAPYAGGTPALVSTGQAVGPIEFAIDGNNNRLFLIDANQTAGQIKILNLTTGALIGTITSPRRMHQVKYDAATNYVYYSTEGAGTNPNAELTADDAIYRIRPDGTGLQTVATSICENIYKMILDIEHNQIIVYQSNYAKRQMITINISNLSSPVITKRSFATSYVYVYDFTYNPNTGYIYYICEGNNAAVSNASDFLARQKLDGTGDTKLITNFLYYPFTMVGDWGNNRIFVNDGLHAQAKIVSVNLATNSYAAIPLNLEVPNSLQTMAVPEQPSVTSASASSVSSTSVTLGGNLLLGYGLNTERGVVYSSTNSLPTVSDSKAIMATSVTNGAYSASVTGLTPSTNYSARAYASNGAGTTYGAVVTFSTTSNNANLSSLSFNAGTANITISPAFTSGTITYTASVDYNINTIKVKPAIEQANATVKVNGTNVASGGTSGDLTLNTGSNTITTIVTAQDGVVTKTYTTTVTREKTPQTINFAAIPSKTYGTVDFDPGANTASTLGITYASSNSAVATIVNNKVHIIGVGTSTITASQGGNNIYLAAADATQVLTVTKAVLTYTADATSRDYGAANPAFTGLVSGFVNGETTESATTGTLSFSSTATTTAAVGTSYPVTGSGLRAENYSFTQAGANSTALSINKITVTYTVQAASKVYGTDNPAFNVVFTGLVNGQVIGDVSTFTTSTIATKSSVVGSYPVTVSGLTSGNYNFTGAAANSTAFTVTKATISYVAQSANKVYGTANPAFSGKLDGFVNGDTEASATGGTLSFSTTASVASAVGSYAITGSGKTSANYTFGQAAANSNAFTITKNTLTYVATPVSRAYNTTTAAAITGTVSGFVNGDTQGSATTGALSFSTAVDINSALGSYAITGSGLSSSNYDIVQSASNAGAYTIFLSTNGNLSSLAISQGTLSPAFSSGTNSYTATVATGITSLTVTPALSDANARVRVNGTQINSGSTSSAIPLLVGDNTISVNVTAQDGTTTNPYNITVKRQPSQDASFSAFSIGGSGVNATQDTNPNNYLAAVAKEVTSFTVTASVNEPNATLHVNGVVTPSGSTVTLPLNKGDNSYTVYIQAQDGTTYEFRNIRIKRAYSAINTMASLDVSSGSLSPAFSPETKNYTLAVDNAVKIVTFSPVVTDTLSYMTQEGLPAAPSFTRNIAIGDNDISIDLQAENGSWTTYHVNVQRAVSHDASLSSLGITTTTGAIEPFDPATYLYNTNVAYDVDALRLNPVAANDGATITINNAPLNNYGNPVIFLHFSVPDTTVIKVIAGDGTTTKIYKIAATRGTSDNNFLASLELTANDGGKVAISPEFDPATNTYTTTISDPANTYVLVKPIKGESHQEIRVNYGAVLNGGSSHYQSLQSGLNVIGIRVLSQNFVARDYTVNLMRAYGSDASLAGVSITGAGTFNRNFNVSQVALDTDVPYNINQLVTLNASANDQGGSTVTVNGYATDNGMARNLPLAEGDNLFVIGVTSADQTKTEYHDFHVRRAAYTDLSLKDIVLSTGVLSPAISPNTTTYTALVSQSTTGISIRPVAGNPAAVVSINGTVIDAANPVYTYPNPLSTSGNNRITIRVATADGLDFVNYTLNIIRPSTSVAFLGDIKLSSASISPAFLRTTQSYTASVENAVSGIAFTPVSPEPAAVITVTGGGNTTTINSGHPFANIPLNVGDNVVTTTITATNGTTTRTYTVTITRGQPATVATLASLSIDNGSLSPVFSSATETYTSSVSYGVDSIKIIPTPTDSHATVKVGGTAASATGRSVLLTAGDNIIPVTVTAEDGSTIKTYTLTINRGLVSADATLSDLILDNGTLSPVFASGTSTYTATVNATTTSVTFLPVLSNYNASVKVNGVEPDTQTGQAKVTLVPGLNTITVSVVAQNGIASKTYTITVLRQGSSNAGLSALALTPYSAFKSIAADPSGTRNYTTSVSPSVSSVRLSVTASDPTASITINGVSTASGTASSPVVLSSGSTPIAVAITAEDGVAVNKYTITVTQQSHLASLKGDGFTKPKPLGNISATADAIVINPALSPNGDGSNDVFNIEGITAFPENKLRIVNRSGKLVYEAKGYDNTSRVFDGRSPDGTLLIQGTYFFVLEYKDGNEAKRKTGYIVLKY